MSGWSWDIDGWIVVVGVLSACSCTLLGNYLVLRRMSLMGDAISHAVLPGLAIAFILTNSRASWPMFVGAALAGVLTALLSELVQKFGKVERGAAMGVVFSILFALGLVLIRRAADHVDLDPGCVLMGNLAQIPLQAIDSPIPEPAITLTVVLVLNLFFVVLFYKELKISTFDPELATTLGINASLMHYLLMIMVAITTVANFESVGSILVIAMLIVPASSAHLLTDRLGVMILFSLLIAAASAVLGHILAAFGPGWVGLDSDANTAAMMAVVSGLFLLAALLLSPQYGVASKLYQRWALSVQILREDILGLLYRRHEQGQQAMTRTEVLRAAGERKLSHWALDSLRRRGQVRIDAAGGPQPVVVLTDAGLARASHLVRSHRLWETYLDRHFQLPPDHLHAPAERMEHYLTPALNEELRADLTDPSLDPHGKTIPSQTP